MSSYATQGPAIALGRVTTTPALQQWACAGTRDRAWAILRAVKAHEAGEGVTLHATGLLTSAATIDGARVALSTFPATDELDAATFVDVIDPTTDAG